jgi:hypothetical protein
LLAERLKLLEQQGMVSRRVLPPPAASTVYELTPLGQSLEKTLLELGRWGRQFVPPSAEGVTVLRPGSYALTLKTFFRPEEAQGLNETYALHIDREVLQVEVKDGELQVQQEQDARADMVLHADMPSYLGLLSGQIDPDEALASGLIKVEGDTGALQRFLNMCRLPSGVGPR